MAPRIKKFIALLVLLPGLAAYVFAAAALGEQIPNNQLLKVLFYFAAGVFWALPVRYLIMWANHEPAIEKTGPNRDAP